MRTRALTLLLSTFLFLPIFDANAERFDSDEHTFGSDAQADGNHVVVGAPGALVDGDEERGQVHVYVRSDTGWSEHSVISASDGAANDKFGDVVAIDDGTIAVGAPYASVNGLFEAGAVYIFERSGAGSWNEVAKIVAADPTTMARFGRDIDLDNGRLAIAAPRADEELGRISGAVYIFERGAGAWQQTAKLQRAAMDQFPREVAISGERVAAGTNGYVLTYRKSDSGWEFFGAVNSDGGPNEIELEGDVLAVAEPQAHLPDIPGPSPGRVQVFEIRDGAWNHVASLESPLPTALDYFGFAMDLRDGLIAIANGYEYNPHVSLFMKDAAGAWTRVHELNGGLPRYEKSIAISAQALVTGVPEPFDSHVVIHDTAELLATDSPGDDEATGDDGSDDPGSGDDSDTGNDSDSGGDPGIDGGVGDGTNDPRNDGDTDNDTGTGETADAGTDNDASNDFDNSGANTADTGSGNNESDSGDAGGDTAGSGTGTNADTGSPAQDSGGGAPGLLFLVALAGMATVRRQLHSR